MTGTREHLFSVPPPAGRGPGVLVLHAWWGLNDFFKGFCKRLADEGFSVLAPDLYHGRLATTILEAEKLRGSVRGEKMKQDILAAVDHLGELISIRDGNLGVIGFSLGAYFALWLAQERPETVRAVTVFYGTRGGDYAKSQAAYLGHFAEKDPYTAASGVKKLEKSLREAGRPAVFHTYPGTGHWFFEQDRKDAFNPDAAALAWDRTVEFLKKQLS
jgi:carboxymethylenebutenolidase